MRYLILLGLAAIMALEIYHASRPTYNPDARCITLCVSPKCVRT